MRRIFQRIVSVVASVCFLVTGISQAATVRGPLMGQTQLCMTSPFVFYINGVWGTSGQEEADSALTLQYRMDAYKHPHAANVSSIFNQSEGKALDIFRKLLSQKAEESLADQLAYSENSKLFAVGASNSLSTTDQALVSNGIASASASLIQTLLQDPLAQETLDLATSAVVSQATQGYPILVVAHSEGNMFAQQLHERLQLKVPNAYNQTLFDLSRSLQVVNVATPAAVSDTGKYVTSSEDIVINFLARILSTISLLLQPAAANADSSLKTYLSDPSGHGFVSVYLNPNLPVNNGSSASMEAEVMRLTGLAENDAAGALSFAPSGAMFFEASIFQGSATFTLTAPDGSTTSVYQDSSTAPLPAVVNLGCSQLQEGTYHLDASITAAPVQSANPPAWTFWLSLYRINFGLAPPLPGAVPIYNYSGNAPDSENVGVADMVVQRNANVGGYTLSFYPYQKAP
jgi:hypothetical protein